MLWRTNGLLVVILVVATVAFGINGFIDLRLGQAFDARGVETTAKVFAREIRRERVKDSSKRRHHVKFAYDTTSGLITQERKVSQSIYAESPPGAPRTVRYLTVAPIVFEVWIGEKWASGQKQRWISLALGLATLAGIWRYDGTAVAAIRARRYGAWEKGVVVRVRARRSKKRTRYMLVWRDASGGIGESLPSGSSTRYEPYQAGAKMIYFGVPRARLGGWATSVHVPPHPPCRLSANASCFLDWTRLIQPLGSP